MPTALVTGASGYVASELVHQLLAAGWAVRGTVRAVDARTDHLVALASALPGSLELVPADLLADGAFDGPVKGCDYVFHVASPFIIATEDPQRELLDPAVLGTVNVLRSVAAAGTGVVRRVVLTSSVAAVHGEMAAPPKAGPLYTCDDWNETSTVEGGQAYHLSKARAEREAWRVAAGAGLDLVTVCPNFVLGPALSRAACGTSVGYAKGMIEGGTISGAPTICDVRDVARAHVLAAITPAASGRYIVSQPGGALPGEVAAALAAGLPAGAALGPVEAPADPADAAKARIDGSRVATELGLVLRPVRETVADMACSLVALGLATPKMGAAE